MNNSLMFSSQSDDWETLLELFNSLNKKFNFTLDVCASFENKKVDKFYSSIDDGLSKNWDNDICWMNPLYGREISKWIKKASESNTLVVALLLARTDTKWFHDYIYNTSNKVEFLKGRLKFNKHKNSALFPSMLVFFNLL